jgi:phosphoglycerate dehydrogenase-like enzyme
VIDIHHALVTVRWARPYRHRLAELIAPARVTWATPSDDAAIRAALVDADVAIVAADGDERFLRAPALRWLHCDHAGIDRFAPPELLGGKITVTTAAGRSAPALGEHALFLMLALSQRAPTLWKAQRRRTWGAPGLHERRALEGRTVCIVGCGHTGSALAHRCAALDMHVLGYRRRDVPATGDFEEVHARDRGELLAPLLERSDVLVLASSLNDGTHRIIDAATLARLPRGALLVNVARGALVDERALVKALHRGHLGGAGLGVATVEPLPPTSRLWRAPNTIITPHATPRVADRDRASLAILADHIERYRSGQPIPGALTIDDAFTGGRRDTPATRRLTRKWNRLVGLRRAPV